MKKNLAIAGLFLFLTLLSLQPAKAAQLGVSDSKGDLTVANNTIIDDNYIAAAQVTKIDGTIKGDLIICSGEAEINGNVEGNLIIVAGNVKINSNIKKDVFVGAGQVEFTERSLIDGDVFIGAGTANLKGQIKGKLYAGTSDISVNGKIDQDTKISSGKVVIGNNAILNGNLNYTSGEEMISSQGATIKGTVTKNITAKQNNNNQNDFGKLSSFITVFATTASIVSEIIGFLSLLLIGILIISILPKYSERVSLFIKERFWPSMGYGFLVWIFTPVIILLAICTIIGIPLSIILLGLYVLLIYLSRIFIGLSFGKLISKNKWKDIWSMTLGVFLLTLFSLIPFIGWIVNFVVILLGLGAATMALTKYEIDKSKK